MSVFRLGEPEDRGVIFERGVIFVVGTIEGGDGEACPVVECYRGCGVSDAEINAYPPCLVAQARPGFPWRGVGRGEGLEAPDCEEGVDGDYAC